MFTWLVARNSLVGKTILGISPWIKSLKRLGRQFLRDEVDMIHTFLLEDNSEIFMITLACFVL
jgi:hypothetical protein